MWQQLHQGSRSRISQTVIPIARFFQTAASLNELIIFFGSALDAVQNI
jgi:hypothetical protein